MAQEPIPTRGGQTWLPGITNYTCSIDILRSRVMHTSYKSHSIDKNTMGIIYRSVPQIRPPFCNLSLSTKRRGGLIHGMWHFLSWLRPPKWVKHDLTVGGGWGPSARQRDAPDASGKLTSFSVEGRGRRALPQSSWRVYRWCGRSVFTVDTLRVDSWVA